MSSVDVVVPCYNYARFLPRCVRSVLDQEGVDVRVLIIDDTSKDDSPEVGRHLASEDPRVEFRRHEVNKGHIATYNEGLLGWASADYVVLLSADDMLAPGALARAARIMDNHPNVGMTYGMAITLGDEPAPQIASPSDDYQVISGKRFIQQCCAAGNPVPTPCSAVRTKMHQELGGYRPELPHSGDMEMWMRFACHGDVGVIRAVTGFYRVHGANMSYQYHASLVADRRERLLAVQEVLDKWGNRVPELREWLAAMTRRLGEETFWIGSAAFDSGDLKGSQTCLEFAAECDPAALSSSHWRSMRLKQALGPSLWRMIGPVIDRLRGTRAMEAPKVRHAMAQGQQFGWWPQAT